jgi:hypothetical protein
MKDLIDFKAIWVWLVEKWRTSFVVFLFSVAAFGSGAAYSEKQIVDDCKFMGSFRDGIQAYSCQPRAR